MNKWEAFVFKRLLSVADKIGVEALKRRLKIISICLKSATGFTIAGELLFWIYAHSSLPFWTGLLSWITFSIIGDRLMKVRSIELGLTENKAPSKLPMTYLFCFLLPKKIRESLLGDIEEEYQEIRAEYGERIAKLWYYKQLLALVWPTLQMSGRTLVKWGAVGWVGEIVRRLVH